MAGIISTIDRATYENLGDTDDGWWAPGSDLGEFTAGRYAAMGRTPRQKAALAAYGREKAARILANWGMGAGGPAKDPGGDGGYGKAFDDVGMWRRQVSAAHEDHSTYAASKAGRLRRMSSFLATDDVPQTLFGIPVVSDGSQYTEADLEFFREHPEAGGYYDMGDEPVQDGTEEGAPVQDDMPAGKAKPPAVTDEELLVRGRSLINRMQGGDRVQLLRRGGFSSAAGKDSAVTDGALLRGPYGKSGSFYRMTLPSGKKVEYYVSPNGQISVPTGDLATDDTSEILDLSRRLVRLHGDPGKRGFTRNGVSVNEFADNLWEHARVIKGEHSLGPIARAVGRTHAEVADVNSGDPKMSVSKALNAGNDWTSVRWREEERRRAANRDRDYDAFLDTFDKPVSVDETTGELYVGDDPPWGKR